MSARLAGGRFGRACALPPSTYPRPILIPIVAGLSRLDCRAEVIELIPETARLANRPMAYVNSITHTPPPAHVGILHGEDGGAAARSARFGSNLARVVVSGGGGGVS
jgi:hypothetical protein